MVEMELNEEDGQKGSSKVQLFVDEMGWKPR